MSFDRVIQDSDDEDDPLLEERSPRAHPPPVVHQSETRAVYSRDTSNDPLNEESSRQIAVNFDEFLASQEGGHVGTSSSQQRREERWIPANAGGGSIGTMVTEIGLAQQRLFDDEDAAQHGSARLGPSDGYGSQGFETVNESNEYIVHQQPEIHIQSTTPPGSYVSLPPQDEPSNDYTNNPDSNEQYEPTSMKHNVSLPSYDRTPSATSYNIFESSLQPSESTYSENNTTLKSHQTIPTEAIQRSPRQGNSTQGTISSPHDTEPNSSILAAKTSRSVSDNNDSLNVPQPPPTSVDEVSLPVETEPPTVGKKRGRPKKQSLPDVDGSDEPAQSTGNEAVEQPPVPEKRKPGRPAKNAKNPEANGSTANAEIQHEDAKSIPKEAESNNTPNQSTTTGDDAAHPADQNESEPADPPRTKKPAKKKLKRGKTTSITLQKTHASDVEDDEIWVESQPSNTESQDATSAPFSINIETHAPQETIEANQTDTIPDQPAAAAAEPAPKKRGRKRKKTSEQALAEPTDQNADTTTNTHPLDTPDTHPENQPSKDQTPNPPINRDPETQPTPLEPPVTPQKPDPKTPNNSTSNSTSTSTNNPTDKSSSKGPDKHSPISSTSKVPYRVGLSRRARIAPLLKIVKR